MVSLLFSIVLLSDHITIVDFHTSYDLSDWYIVNDGVMGGLSQSAFVINDDGQGEFSGYVTLENNGGFASVRQRSRINPDAKHSKFVIRLKGDGKRYQFRSARNQNDYHQYVAFFETSGEWETIEIPFDNLYPSWRGRTLDYPNYNGEQLREIGFLIGNKTQEEFKLLIEKIEIQ